MARWRRVQRALAALASVIVAGSIGYVLLGFSVLDAVYQTVTTVTTVGFREVRPLDGRGQVFTIVLILVGVGTALYTFSVFIESVLEGELTNVYGRRRMERRIDQMNGHVVICGWGRVGRQLARYLTGAGRTVVVVDTNPDRLAEIDHPTVMGDATEDETLELAGVRRASALVAAVDTDPENMAITLAARSICPELFIVARARTHSSEPKMLRAGADRVVNPQAIGGERMAAFVVAPNVAEFLDVVMHDGSLEFRLQEVTVPPRSPLAGATLREAGIRERTGALVLAIRNPGGSFTTNPEPDMAIEPGQVLIAIGTATELANLERLSR